MYSPCARSSLSFRGDNNYVSESVDCTFMYEEDKVPDFLSYFKVELVFGIPHFICNNR
jgi:hypothetical protein